VPSVIERLQAAADKQGLTAEQGWQIVDTPKNFDGEYETSADDRREVLRSEPKAVGEILTRKQHDTVRNDFQGHGVIDIQVDPNDPQAAAMPKETIAERLKGRAEKLGLTQKQRDKIRATDPGLAAKCNARREQREALRTEELKASGDILCPSSASGSRTASRTTPTGHDPHPRIARTRAARRTTNRGTILSRRRRNPSQV
jgi:hypothetical protein